MEYLSSASWLVVLQKILGQAIVARGAIPPVAWITCGSSPIVRMAFPFGPIDLYILSYAIASNLLFFLNFHGFFQLNTGKSR